MSKTVPDDWANGKFGDLARVQNGYAFKSSDFSERGHAAAIRMSNLKNGRIDLSDAKYVPERIVEGLDQFRLSEGDFLFGMSGSLDNYAWVTRDTGICYLNQRVGCLRANPRSDSLFTAYCYLSETVKREIVGLAAGAAQLNISGSQLEAIPVPIPPLPEQQKIAAILSSADDVIEKTRAQIDKLKDLKTGMMQELLTKGIGHTEFKDSPVGSIPESWRHSTIGELVTKVGSGITPKGGSSSYVDFGVPLIRSQNVHPDGLRLDDVSYITDQQHQKMANSQLEPNDVLLNITGASIGRCYYLPADFGHGNVNQHVCIIRGRQNHIHPVFLTLFLNSEFGQRQIMSLQAGGNREGLNFQQVRAIKLPLPTLYEQQKIADSVSSIDQHIQKRRAKLSQANNVKKALMQDLLTGKVRVKIDQKESAVA